MEVQLKVTEAEIKKLNLETGDTLLVTVKGDDFDHHETMTSLQEALRKAFPNNKIMVFSMNSDHSINFEAVKAAPTEGEKNEPQSSGT